MTNFEFLMFILLGQVVPALICPGPSTILAMTAANSKGKLHGVYVSLGIAIGCTIWFIVIPYGLADIFQKSKLIKNTVTILGSLYMIYLSYTIIRKFDIDLVEKKALKTFNGSAKKKNLFDDFKKGFIATILNPEAPTFFIIIFQQILSHHNNDTSYLKYYIVILTVVTFLIISSMAVSADFIFNLFKKYKKYTNIVLGSILGVTAARIFIFAIINILK